MAGTRLADVEERKRLVTGGREAVASSADPLTRLARPVDPDPEVRRHRRLQDGLGEQEWQTYDRIAEARFAVEGSSNYPDAISSLRLSFGTVRGYRDEGQDVPACGGWWPRSRPPERPARSGPEPAVHAGPTGFSGRNSAGSATGRAS